MGQLTTYRPAPVARPSEPVDRGRLVQHEVHPPAGFHPGDVTRLQPFYPPAEGPVVVYPAPAPPPVQRRHVVTESYHRTVRFEEGPAPMQHPAGPEREPLMSYTGRKFMVAIIGGLSAFSLLAGLASALQGGPIAVVVFWMILAGVLGYVTLELRNYRHA
jgi:hypothetical protein